MKSKWYLKCKIDNCKRPECFQGTIRSTAHISQVVLLLAIALPVLAFGKQGVESCLTKNYDKTHVMNMNMNQPVCCFQQSCNIVAVST